MENLLYPEVKEHENSATGNQIAAELNFFFKKKEFLEREGAFVEIEGLVESTSSKLLKLVCYPCYAEAYVHWFGKGESESVEYIVEIDTSERRFIEVVEVNGTQDDYRVGTIFKLNKNCSDV